MADLRYHGPRRDEIGCNASQPAICRHVGTETERIVLIPSVLVVDDDEGFLKILERIASDQGFPVTACRSAAELLSLPEISADVAIVDYHLGDTSGVGLVELLQARLPSVPVVLVSQENEIETGRWPEPIKKFVHKTLGPVGIFGAAFEVFQLSTLEENLERYG